MPQIFLDCDGVLADFDAAAALIFQMHPRDAETILGTAEFWRRIHAVPDFFRNLPKMADADQLYHHVAQYQQPAIITGVPDSNPDATRQKQGWRIEHYPEATMICCASKDKRLWAQPGDILIDDWPKYRHLWEEMGGIFILHTSAAQSIAELEAALQVAA